jgi:very-short-patch-repair endonuclease
MPYVVDFLCIAAKVVVELDGPPHESPERRVKDAERDAWLKGQGFLVLRFSDLVLGNCQLVLDTVLAAIWERLFPSPGSLRSPPSPAEGGREARAIAPAAE